MAAEEWGASVNAGKKGGRTLRKGRGGQDRRRNLWCGYHIGDQEIRYVGASYRRVGGRKGKMRQKGKSEVAR